jgi:hypothetical protein
MPLSPDVLRHCFAVLYAGWQVSMRRMFFELSSLRSLHLDAKVTRAANEPPLGLHKYLLSRSRRIVCMRTYTEAGILHGVLPAQKHVNLPYGPHLSPEDADINSNRYADKMNTVDKRITSNNSTWPRRELCLRTQCHQNSGLLEN